MKKIFKLTLNTILLSIFLSIMALPMAFMGTAKFEEGPVVLSAQDSKEQNPYRSNNIKRVDDLSAEIPEDVREMILRMEREYYQTQEQEFAEDIERNEEKEQTVLKKENTIDKEFIE